MRKRLAKRLLTGLQLRVRETTPTWISAALVDCYLAGLSVPDKWKWRTYKPNPTLTQRARLWMAQVLVG